MNNAHLQYLSRGYAATRRFVERNPCLALALGTVSVAAIVAFAIKNRSVPNGPALRLIVPTMNEDEREPIIRAIESLPEAFRTPIAQLAQRKIIPNMDGRNRASIIWELIHTYRVPSNKHLLCGDGRRECLPAILTEQDTMVLRQLEAILSKPELEESLDSIQGCVVHIPQLHSRPEDDNDPWAKRRVVHSQLDVARAIENNPNVPVLVEDLWGETKDGDPSVEEGYQPVQDAFPQGIPAARGDLSFPQAELLYKYGAPRILFLLKKIPILHGVVRPHRENEFKMLGELTQVDATNASKVFAEREIEALVCAKKVLSQQSGTHNPKVLLVFGAGHDFAKSCQQASLVHEKIQTVSTKAFWGQ